jgi:hypothetical protein
MFPLIILSAIVVAIVTVALMRYFTRRNGNKELVAEGARLTENGIEIPNYFWLGKRMISYSYVEKFELMPWYKVALQVPLLRYGIAVHSISTRLFHDTVIIKFNGPNVFETILLTPSSAREFLDELQRRVQESKSTSNRS